jgi:hypothetical protein
MSKGAVLFLSLSAVICLFVALHRKPARFNSSPAAGEAKPRVESRIVHFRATTLNKRQHLPSPDAAPVQEDDAMTTELVRAIGEILTADLEKLDLVYTNLLPALIVRDALAAAKIVEEIEPGTVREELIRRLVQAWSARDAASALAWIDQLRDGDERSPALANVCFQIAQTSPQEALRTAERFGLGQSPAIENLAQQWAARDLSAALAWARALPANEQREKIFARLAYVQSERDPLNAARFVAEEIPSGPTQTEAAISVLHQWAFRDFAAAARWSEHFPEGPLRERAQNEVEGIGRYRLAMEKSN